MATNPFDIDQFNGVTFDDAEAITIIGYDPTPSPQSSFVDPSGFANEVSNLGSITVIDSSYVAGFYESRPGYYGYPATPIYHLPTFGAVQFDNIKDADGNPITFWIHGFSENGIFVTEVQDTFYDGDNLVIAAGIGGYGRLIGFYGIDTPNGVPRYDVTFDKDVGNFAVVPPDPPCFAEGTRIDTVDGPIAVEQLSVGDLVLTASGISRPITWIGHSLSRPAKSRRPQEFDPIRVRAHAFGDNLPLHDVRLSPGHAVYVDGVLVPVANLVNGATIVQEAADEVRYFHVELETHDVLLAEGLPCESYLDDGNRASFANAGAFARIHGRLDPRSWENACAPMVAGGPQLIAICERLHAQAEALGWTKSEEADLTIEADGISIAPEHRSGNRFRFQVPAATRLLLHSSCGVLAHVMPGVNDTRRLGVAVSELRIDGVAVDLDDSAFAAGFYPVEQQGEARWRWTDGEAALDLALAGPAAIEVSLIMVAPSWRLVDPAVRTAA